MEEGLLSQLFLSPHSGRNGKTFRKQSGLWEFNGMPFGLKGAPATFCRKISSILEHSTPLQLVLYVDDLCTISDSFQVHLERLRIFETIHKHGLRVNTNNASLP